MPKEKKNQRNKEKRGPGRPPRMPASEVVGRAIHYALVLGQVWNRLWPVLSVAQTDEEVLKSLSAAQPYESYFSPSASLILEVINERRFPKRRKAQIQFLADSLAGLGMITPRRSRDICAEERIKEMQARKAHRILRFEYYVECSCGYKGHSKEHACRKCGAKIEFPPLAAYDPFGP